MAEIAGSASIVLKADTSQLKKGLDQAESTTKSKLSGVASAAKSAGIAAAGALAAAASTAAAAIGAVTTQSVKAYAAFEQSVGGIETLFGDAADTVLANADTAFQRAQISANTYMETVTSFSASLIQSLGGDTQKAAEYADRALTDMADNANKMGTDLTMIQNAYSGFAKANYTMLDNLKLGYSGTKSEAERLIQDASQMTEEMEKLGVVVDADSMDFANLVNAISVVQEHMGIAGTTAKEATETIAGSMNMAKASAQDLIRGLADPNADIGKLFDNMANSAMTFGKNIGKTILRILPNVTTAISKLVSGVISKLPEIMNQVLPPLMDAIIGLTNELLGQLPAITDGFIKLTTQVIMSIAQQLPQLLQTLTQAIMGIIAVLLTPDNLNLMMKAGLELLMGLVKAIPLILTAVVEALPDLIMGIVDWLTSPDTYVIMFEAMKQLLIAIVDAIPTILGALFEAFKKLITALWDRLKTIFTKFAQDFGKGIGNALIHAINGVIGAIESFINAPIKMINGIVDTLNGIPGVEIGYLSEITLGRIPELARGGYANGATPAIIGEAGPEVVIPLERSDTWAKAIATQLAAEFTAEGFSGAQTVNVYMTNEINNKLDIDEVSRELVTSIRRAI